MADTRGARISWGSELLPSRQCEPEKESSKYEAPVFVPQTPSTVARRHPASTGNLAESLSQRKAHSVTSLSKVSKERDHISSSREEFLKLRQEVLDLQEYDKAYERAKISCKKDSQRNQPVLGFEGAKNGAHANERRRRMSLGSQMEFIQNQLDAHTQPRARPSLATSATPHGRSIVVRTAPPSRSNSIPKGGLGDESENPFPVGTARALQFERLSESLPDFKPREVKCERNKGSVDVALASLTANPSPKINCLANVRTVSKSESNSPMPQSPRGRQSTPTKYLSARAVAERLVKVIRGGSKSSKNKGESKFSTSDSNSREASGFFSVDGSGGKGVDHRPASYTFHGKPEHALDEGSISADFDEKSQISSFRVDMRTDTTPRDERELDALKSWLEGMKQQGEGVNDDLEKKAKATCERLGMLDEEQTMLDDRQLCLNDLQSSDNVRSSDTMAAVHQRLRRMHEEKKFLALEAASELRRRVSEQSAARKVFALMKREMDAYAKVMEKEKLETQNKLEEEIGRRESAWAVKLDRIRSEDRELRKRVVNLEEENSYMQKEISSLLSRDGNMRGMIKELESQVDMYRTQTEHAEAELDALHQAYADKESEIRNLKNILERYRPLCDNHEKRMNTLQQGFEDDRVEDPMSTGSRKPSNLQRELSRLSSLEAALRSEMQVLKAGPQDVEDKLSANRHVQRSMEEIHTELDRLESQTGELQDDNDILSVKLRLALREKEEMQKALRNAEEVILELREEWQQLRDYGQDGRAEESWKKSQAAVGAQELEVDSGSQESRQVTRPEAADQLQVQESRLLGMNYELGKQNDIIRGLEHNLAVAGNAVESQKLCIMRLSSRNEELVRLYHRKENEVEDLRILSSNEAEGRRICEQELSLLKEQAFKCKQEIRAQDLKCKILDEKLSTKEAELEQRNTEVTALEDRRDWLEAEVKKLQRLLGEASHKATTFEHQCEEQKEKIKVLQIDVDGHVTELMKLKDILPQLSKERDSLSHEAEQMGREALKLSAEVEVLRRKVIELDEDVMVRDGQITILCHSLKDLK